MTHSVVMAAPSVSVSVCVRNLFQRLLALYYHITVYVTIGLENTVVDCLERLNRTRLLDDDSLDSIEMRLGDGDVTSTLFAPTETVLMDTEADNETIASHLATGSFRAERLYSCQRLTTVASGRFIHVTSVRVSKHNIINYCVVATDNYEYFLLQTRGSSTRRLFVNGVEVTRANACFAKNGVVHEINGVIMSSSRTILQVLDDTPDVSSFKELVSKAGLNNFLSKKYPKTVFAPSNSAIDSNTMTCLCRSENRNILRSFVKFHIVSGAEYNSTIRLRTNLHPLSCGRWYWRRRCSIPVTIDGRDTTVGGSRIVDADIAASNGVIHTLSRPLSNPNLNLSARCPPAPTQPTTVPTTTAPPKGPSTTASSDTPTTASPSATRPH